MGSHKKITKSVRFLIYNFEEFDTLAVSHIVNKYLYLGTIYTSNVDMAIKLLSSPT